jgi:hypothetical protein
MSFHAGELSRYLLGVQGDCDAPAWIDSETADRAPRHKPRKNKRRWCKGRAGVGHVLAWEVWHIFGGASVQYDRLRCLNCGKVRGFRRTGITTTITTPAQGDV